MGWWTRRGTLWPTPGLLRRMARHPSAFAPPAADILAPDLAEEPGDLLDLAAARDVVTDGGRVVGMSLTGRSFLTYGGRLLDAYPLREVRLIAVAFLLDELAACPHLPRLPALDIRGNGLTADDLRGVLATMPSGAVRW